MEENKIIADLHFHSKYSRAVSQQMDLQTITAWAIKKGIDLLVTSDFTHPLWIREVEAKLVEINEGVYRLKENTKNSPFFVIGGEISSIYSQNGKVRRIHNLVIAPNLSAAQKIIKELEAKGFKLDADGRPTINLTGEEFADLVFSQDPNCLIIPCHVWTPWFSLYGSRSGFDSIRECFGKYESYITAVETGLSSDPAMNWQIKELDLRQIVSFSDAHSPRKLGREATIFGSQSKTKKEFAFSDLVAALSKNKKGDWEVFSTLEFYPQEGKYYYNGHRQCQICRSPQDTQKQGSLCPVCGKPLTIGVLHRVLQLANRSITPKKQLLGGVVVNYHPQNLHPPFINLVPLEEIIAEAFKVPSSSKVVSDTYEAMITSLGTEFNILLKTPIQTIISKFGERVGKGIEKVRKQDLVIEPGYDGVYGKVGIWKEPASKLKEKQMGLF